MYHTIAMALATALMVSAAPMEERDSEMHEVIMINNCGQGEAKWLYQGGGPYGDADLVGGPLFGGIAWLDGFNGPSGPCESSGVNCGAVEFTLTNQGYAGDNAGNAQNAIDYTLQSQGNHQFAYPMNAYFTGGCGGGPGQCGSAGSCAGAFTGTNTADGSVAQCVANNVGITIQFC